MIKNYLLGLKLDFIIKVAPEKFTHWNENKEVLMFYGFDEQPVIIQKPLWLRCIEIVVYKR